LRSAQWAQPKTNFYNDAYRRAGYHDDALAVQQLWLDGQRDAAVARVQDDLVTRFSAIGTAAMVQERFDAYQAVGVNCLYLRFDGAQRADQYALLEQVCAMAA